MNDLFYTYDIETYPNFFCFGGKFKGDDRLYQFEISTRKNELPQLLSHISYLHNANVIGVGYNSLPFDYPITHWILNNQHTATVEAIYLEAQRVIEINNARRGWGAVIRYSERAFRQLDLMKLHHFDNIVKATSLKALQFAMRSESLEDLPIKPGTHLTFEQMDKLLSYNGHDIFETEKFLIESEEPIRIRQELIASGTLKGDLLNWSDVKLGTEYLVNKIGKQKCYDGGQAKQTIRTEVPFQSIILPKIYYRTENYQAVLDWFKQQTLWMKSGTTPKLETTLADLQFHFGVGGVHASVESKYFETTSTHVIKDIDVGGMYPAVAVANGFAPEHLGRDFTLAYKQLRADRAQYKKGTVMNLVLKLAGNGVFGNSNNDFSVFHDPKFTFSITVNGQLQLLQLVESLSLIPGIKLIQVNTDGITALVPREVEHLFELWKSEWERETGLQLEEAEYQRMWIRDVNNYLAIDTKGKIKRKGAYWYPVEKSDMWGSSGSNWNKDFSNLASIKAVEQCLVDRLRAEDAIRLISNPFDFLIRYKTPGGSQLYIGNQPQLRTVRYYVSKSGSQMYKISKPKGEIGDWKRRNSLTDAEFYKIKASIPKGQWDERIYTKNKSKYEEVRTSIESGRKVKECNHIRNFDWNDVDYDYYINETKKLLIGGT
jgi:hypothetical protein